MQRKTMLAPDVLAVPSRQDVTLVKALARAHRWRQMLEGGTVGTVKELAAVEKINASYLCRVLRLTLLAPAIVEVILDGRQPQGVTLPALMEGVAVEWRPRKEFAKYNLPESNRRTESTRKQCAATVI